MHNLAVQDVIDSSNSLCIEPIGRRRRKKALVLIFLHAFRSINSRVLGEKSKSKSFLVFFLGFKVSHFHAGFT